MKIIPLINEITHIFKNIENSFPKSIPTFYRYIHNGHFPSLNDEMLVRAYSYKPRKRTGEENKIRIDNSIRRGRTLDNMKEYLNVHQNANIVEMDTVIGKQEDKKCILTLYFRNSKLMLMFLIDKYKTNAVSNIFKKIRNELGYENFKFMFEIVLTDNGWEFSKPNEIEFDYNTGLTFFIVILTLHGKKVELSETMNSLGISFLKEYLLIN